MKRKTLRFMDIKQEDILDRREMKTIMAGGSDKECKPDYTCDPHCAKKQPGGGYLCSTCCVA